MAETDATAAIWDEYEVSPVEIALPGNKVGLTLRAYRPVNQLTPTDATERENDDDVFTSRDARRHGDDEDELPEFEWTEEALDEIAAAPAEDELAERAVEAEDKPAKKAAKADEAEDADEEDAETDGEEVPIFLSHKGKLLLFRSAQGLLDFVRSRAPHDLAQLDDWSELVSKIKVDDIAPGEGDTYELDLVVENLRGGPEAWDNELLLRAGELARDLGYALQLRKVMLSLAPDSPLDTLDETLRSTESGGVGGFLARRKLKKIGAEQSSLGWRTIIGNISSAVDWRD